MCGQGREGRDRAHEVRIRGDRIEATLDGSKEFTEQEAHDFRLTPERARSMRNYYTYLWGLPMKLRDPGTRISQQATDSRYQKKRVWEVRVTYDESVGKDTWYFYFDQETYALVGYRFYHDETANDGEYITLDEEVAVSSMRIPANRRWFVNADDRFLGEDVLVAAR